MTNRRHPFAAQRRRARARGLSLVELMIAMTIALGLTVVASYAYLGSKQTYRAGDEQSELYEEARFALGMLGQQIRSAGYSPAVEPPTAQALTYFNHPLVPRKAIDGCEGGFNKVGLTCVNGADAAADALYVAYVTDNPDVNNNAALGIGVDCAGRNAVSTVMLNGAPMYLVENWFYLENANYNEGGIPRTTSQLSCKGNGGAAQRLFQGVRDLQLLYGVSSDLATQAVNQLLTAREATDRLLWENVVSMQICLTMETLAAGVSLGAAAADYTDCNGASQRPPQGLIRRSFTNTFNLRNRVTG